MMNQQPLMFEASIVRTKNILLVFPSSSTDAGNNPPNKSLEELIQGFCGTVVLDFSSLDCLSNISTQTVYLCGEISKAKMLPQLIQAQRVFIINDLSFDIDMDENITWTFISSGQVPLLVHGVGVFYRQFFDHQLDLFNRISAEHVFQSLSESNKPGIAHRTGIYLTSVEEKDNESYFHLLRCSSNFSGPTANFCATDRRIVDSLNHEANFIFENPAPLNHVLAQIYHNNPHTDRNKQTKAKIKAHSDKTKDMPFNNIMAFCSFYDHLDHLTLKAPDSFDYNYKGKGHSALTTLYFRLKSLENTNLPHEFNVTLYPDSVFFIPSSTNRLYTHEIKPSLLDARILPTRMGYVVRCSSTLAVHRDGETFIKMNENQLIPLVPPTDTDMANLRELYARENLTDQVVDYGPTFFSMNHGDYQKPIFQEEFRWLEVPLEENLFDSLQNGITFDDVTKGRKGTVLVLPHESRGVPIVRTTTKYTCPAQQFHLIHQKLAQQIQNIANLSIPFNNALIEVYYNAYATMGFHSDQALDLENNSSIAIFSCYKYPHLLTTKRKLIVQSKENGNIFEIPLLHNSIVVFHTQTNTHFLHKIILENATSLPENEWLGLTLRTSKTFIRYQEDQQVCFENGNPLSLADQSQCREFYSLRRSENNEINFQYPPLSYSISMSDLLPPVPPNSQLLAHDS